MRKALAILIVAVSMLGASSFAVAAPAQDALPTAQPCNSSPVVPAQPMTDSDMAQVVGGQINVPPGLAPPQPPIAGFINTISEQYGTDPGHVGTAYGLRPGLATFIRHMFPSSSPGLGQLFH